MMLEFLMAYGQPPKWVGVLGAMTFVVFVLAAVYNGLTNPKYQRKTPINLDLFEIGYILPSKTVTPVATKDNPIYNDCVLAMRSMGYKAAESKSVATRILATHNVGSVEEFITIALSKGA